MNGLTSRRARLVVLVSGRGTNLQAIIDEIEAGKLNATIEAVISDRQGAQALSRAKAHGMRTIALEFSSFASADHYHETLRSHLDDMAPDLVILSGYMRILPTDIVAAYRWRILNIHPSLLPAFPGLQPQKQALDYGVKFSGCTVHFVDEGVDTGPIISQAVVPVHEDDTPTTLAARILVEEHRLYPEAIRSVLTEQMKG